jgi:extracellular factor (EF) 3-hydroxypalmitic acid methyl ester biosynthesis protein
MEELKRIHHRSSQFTYSKKSVNLILKEGGKRIERSPEQQYDFVYCAGLYDYLSDQLCHRLSNILYEWVAPGGLLVTTNVDGSNPRRLTMDYLMEWHLIYRTGAGLAKLKPDQVSADDFEVRSDTTGVNIYFATRKPQGD